MPFKKGKPKTGGKKKGTPNKRTEETLKRIEYVLSLLDQTIDKDIQSLKPNERAAMWRDLQEYIRPKLARQEMTGKDGKDLIFPETNINFINFTDASDNAE